MVKCRLMNWDFQKAFDHVDRKILWGKARVPHGDFGHVPQLVRMVQEVYIEQRGLSGDQGRPRCCCGLAVWAV